MVHIDVSYDGELRCSATHGPSQARLQTDAPVDNHGKGESYSPTDLVATALGTCMLTIMGIAAERHGIELGGASAQVVKHMSSDTPRRISKLSVSMTLPEQIDAEQRQLLERAAHSCPVAHSLREDLQIELTIA